MKTINIIIKATALCLILTTTLKAQVIHWPSMKGCLDEANQDKDSGKLRTSSLFSLELSKCQDQELDEVFKTLADSQKIAQNIYENIAKSDLKIDGNLQRITFYIAGLNAARTLMNGIEEERRHRKTFQTLSSIFAPAVQIASPQPASTVTPEVIDLDEESSDDVPQE